MRTTITLDDDVVIGLKYLQKKNPKKSFKELVNQVIKQGLAVSGNISSQKFEVKPLKAVHNPNFNFDNISKLIETVEGDWHK